MKKRCLIAMLYVGLVPLLFAETNALIEVELFKTWVIGTEWCCGGLTIENTGTVPLPLAKTAEDFEIGQLATRTLDNKIGDLCRGGPPDLMHRDIAEGGEGFEMLPVGEKNCTRGGGFYSCRAYLFQKRCNSKFRCI